MKMNELFNLKKNMSVPNMLSFLRIVLIVPFVLSFMKDNYVLAGILLILSGVSDFFDGMIARKFNQITSLGKMLDPTADKLTLMAVMVCVGLKLPRIFVFMLILIIKEILMLLAGLVLINRNQSPPAAQWYGKLATVVFYVSVITIITLKALWNVDNGYINFTLMVITAVCMIYALFRYFKIFKSMTKSSINS